jgi:hypothetical protein
LGLRPPKSLFAKTNARSSTILRDELDDSGTIEGCDIRISRLEFRLSALLREVERRNQIVARDADKAASAIVDAEFTEAVD